MNGIYDLSNINFMKYTLLAGVISLLLLSGCAIQNSENQGNTDQTGNNSSSQNSQSQAGRKLDLSGQNLERIPGNVFERTDLEELDVSNNRLTGAIQAEIRLLKNLKVLRAGNNKMTGVPAEIGQLNNLEILDLSNNRLTGLPNELGNLKNLKTFNISGNNYSSQDLDIITKNLPDSVNIIK